MGAPRPTFIAPAPIEHELFTYGNAGGGRAGIAIGDGLKEVIWYDIELSRIFVWNVAGTPGPLLADWPMYHHDPKHSNAPPPTPATRVRADSRRDVAARCS